ncbi:MAG: aldehyde dehydrogenase [Proteobacteria bacterium]|nr:aldehyde dehydrogenase [Pseudomonadota bacterium]
MKSIDKLRQAHLSAPLDYTQRVHYLGLLAEKLKSSQEEIMQALSLDLGKGRFESWSTEIGFLLQEISHLQKTLPDLMEPQKVSTPIVMQPGSSYIYHEPYGVVLVMAPWNYPIQLAFSPLIGALAAGNRVVVKPSELTPHCADLIAKIVKEIFPEDLVQVVLGGVQETGELLKEKFDYIFFTGSTQVGKVVMRAAAEHLTPVTLELGGKSPCLIDRNTNLKMIARRIAWGKWMNAGQTCVAPDYLLVHRSDLQALVAELKNAIHQFYSATPKASEDFGRIVSLKHFDRLKSLLDQTPVLLGGESVREERFMAPTVLGPVDWEAVIMQDEIFGPLLPIIVYDQVSEVIAQIKSRPKPLAFYLFTNDEGLQKRVLSEISFGGGCVNDTIMHLANPRLPFGGVGESGMGAYHGDLSFYTFSHRKSVFKQTTLIDVPVRYPPYKGKEGLVKFLVK